MKEFLAKYWAWMVGAFGIIVLVRSYKVATNSAFYNQQSAGSAPFKNAGGAQVTGSGGSTGLLGKVSQSDTQTVTQNGKTTTQALPATEQGLNAGAENGSGAANYLNRGIAISLGQNSYAYTDPVKGTPETMYIHTMYYLGIDYSGTGTSEWYLVFSTNAQSDTTTPLALGDAGTIYDGNSDVSGSAAYWPLGPNGVKASNGWQNQSGPPAGYGSPWDTGLSN